MRHSFLTGTAVLALIATSALADDGVYGPYPVTVKGYEGSATNSVSYSGQIARQVMENSLRKLAKTGNGSNAAEVEAEMLRYFDGSDDDLAIISPASKDGFAVKQTSVQQISSPNLAGKIYDGAMPGWPGHMTGKAVAYDIIKRAAASTGGFDPETGMDYEQILSKYLNGAVMYHQAVDNYLDEKMTADTKPNDKPYKAGAAYTGKEHSWDEAFGYWGAPAHTAMLSPDDIYNISKRKGFEAADINSDGVVDLKTEFVFQPAYYSASFDRSGKTTYAADIMGAFLDGRAVITAAAGEALSAEELAAVQGHAATIAKAWEKVLAEAVFKYAGSVYKDINKMGEATDDAAKAKAYRAYAKHWGELKGFAMGLQTGKNNLGAAAVKLNNLIGYGPVTLDNRYVTGVDADGNFEMERRRTWSDYQLHMLKIQQLMVDTFGVEARSNDQLAQLEGLAQKLGNSNGAETD